MTGFQSLYDADQLAILQAVGYPNPDESHFRATDIWLSGADSDQYLDTGWTRAIPRSDLYELSGGLSQCRDA